MKSCLFESKSGFLTWKTIKNYFLGRITFYRLGWVKFYRYQKIHIKFCQIMLFVQKMYFWNSVPRGRGGDIFFWLLPPLRVEIWSKWLIGKTRDNWEHRKIPKKERSCCCCWLSRSRWFVRSELPWEPKSEQLDTPNYRPYLRSKDLKQDLFKYFMGLHDF